HKKYRLCAHVATDSATDFDVWLDSVKVTPQSTAPGAIQEYIGQEVWTVTGATATATVDIYRSGKEIVVSGRIAFTGTASANVQLDIPEKYRPVSYGTGTLLPKVGRATYLDEGTATYEGDAVLNSRTAAT